MAVESYRPIARSIEQLTNDYMREEPTYIFADFQWNIEIAINAIKDYPLTDEALRWGGPTIRNVVRLVAANEFKNPNGTVRFRFTENPQKRDALNFVYSQYPQFSGCGHGNDLVFIRKAIADGFEFNRENLMNVIVEPDVWGKLSTNDAHQQSVRAENSKQQMINYINKNSSSNFSYYPINVTTGKQSTNPRTYDKDGFEITFSSAGGRAKKNSYCLFDDEAELRYAYNQILAKRQAIEMHTQGTLGKHVDQLAKQHYQDRFHGDPGSTQLKTSAAAVLTDPRSGQAITTRLGLIAYINSSPDALARLVKPRGTTVRERARAVDALLNQRD